MLTGSEWMTSIRDRVAKGRLVIEIVIGDVIGLVMVAVPRAT